MIGKLERLTPTANKDADTMRHILDTLFPTHPELKDQADLELIEDVMWRVAPWLENHELEVAARKTKMVLLTRKEIDTIIPLKVQEEVVMIKNAVKYLRVTLDRKLTFLSHLRQEAKKAVARVAASSQMLPNVRGPKIQTGQVQRIGALRIACGYRSVSESAVMVIAGVISIDLLAREGRLKHLTKQDLGRMVATKNAREITWERWQHRWQEKTTGKWTARLIKDVKELSGQKHGEVDDYLI
ncbi:uncharacterized protein LOC111643915 [Copidosoma floridanum]|uniref:uncharacterized protein LOC111643915 n=1 Tax=Copidosoma floridanum TaxID=29053 RepID=UPI000C6F98A2|nr:uncharacterized protein LOC111643915 [Copidosoma floridanum]